jgi:hypothetical protein
VQQHLGRLVGVDKVDVNLGDGQVVILAKQDSQLDPQRVFKATFDSGVSIAEMTMEATGALERGTGDTLVLRTSNSQVFAVLANDVSKQFGETVGSAKVFVRARLYKKSGKQQPKTLGAVRLELLEIRNLQ